MSATRIETISATIGKGHVEGIFVTEEEETQKYRIYYTEGRRDEWIRFDHKRNEPYHLHLRTVTRLLTKKNLLDGIEDLIPVFHDLRRRFQ